MEIAKFWPLFLIILAPLISWNRFRLTCGHAAQLVSERGGGWTSEILEGMKTHKKYRFISKAYLTYWFVCLAILSVLWTFSVTYDRNWKFLFWGFLFLCVFADFLPRKWVDRIANETSLKLIPPVS